MNVLILASVSKEFGLNLNLLETNVFNLFVVLGVLVNYGLSAFSA